MNNSSNEARKHHWWSDNADNRAVIDHLWRYLVHHPRNGIYIKGTQKWTPESIEVASIKDTNVTNVNIHSDDAELRSSIGDAAALVLDQAYINKKTYTLKKKELIQHTLNLTLTW
ncbi:hypothetical protein [Sphingobacterium kyonggiense]